MGTERGRHQLYEELKSVMSQESADELMAYLPPVGWADVATKADIAMLRNEMDAMRADLRGEMALFRGEIDGMRADLTGEVALLRGEMGGLRGEMALFRGEIDGMRADQTGEVALLRGEMGGLRGEMGGLRGHTDGSLASLRAEMHQGFVTQTRWMVGAIFTAIPLGILLSHAVT